MSYPKRRAAAIAEELTKQELAQDEGNDDDDDDDEDANFKAEEAPPAAQAAGAGPKRKRGPSGLALSDSDDEGGGAAAAAGGARATAQAARTGGGTVLNSLEQLKDAAKRRKTDALFEELNGGPKPAASSAAAASGVPAKGSKMKCMMRAQVRAGPEMSSAAAGELKLGEMLEVLETKVLETGATRCRFARGWVSVKTGAGATILQRAAAPASMFPGGTRTAAGSSGLSIEALAKKLASKGPAGTPAAAEAAGPAGAPVPGRKNKMNDILAGLKKGQISTTAKSRGQWDSYKKDAGIDEELKQKAKDGYIVKQEFLERVDWRTHEKELENKKDVGWKGMN